MKLINKKTGEIKDFGNLQVYAETENTDESQLLGNFDSFKQILEYYEDYIPKEPLIKDPKIRMAVRAWADMNKIEKAGIQKIITEARGLEDSWYQITGQDKNMCLWKIEIHASYLETVSKDYKENMVTVTELCGEEKE